MKDFHIIRRLITADVASLVRDAMFVEAAQKYSPDKQCPKSHSAYASPLSELLMIKCRTRIEEETKLQLLPTYAYHRVYFNGEELKPHLDRPSCEISCSVFIGSDPEGVVWPIFMNGTALELAQGDAVIYRGAEVCHWREKLAYGAEVRYCQIFMHYVTKNGLNADCIWDGRTHLIGNPPTLGNNQKYAFWG